MSNFPRGSEWRRWDLHVHTPASIVQNYGGNSQGAWDRYVEALAALPSDIQVLGITDYLFIDGYETLLQRRADFQNIKTLLPNIEFRLNTFSGTTSNNKRHNFHVIFDPSVSPETIREQLLNCLSTAYLIADGTEWHRTPTHNSLIELGRQVKAAAPVANSVRNHSDLQAGFASITYKREDILKNLRKDCFKGRYLLAIGYSEWDQARWDQSAAEKRTLINEAHFSLVSNDDVAKIAEHVEDLAKNNLNTLLLHSSDAHDIDRLGGTKMWIRADPTFAGLKQVVNEHERAFIGDSPPQLKNRHQVIERVSFGPSAGWFGEPFELTLNDGLVAIIGGRGSGKSALADMLACAVGAADGDPESFIYKAGQHPSSINGTNVRVTWGDGSEVEGNAGTLADDQGTVRYLPQKAVETLCSPDNHEALVTQIENVIFQALDETTRLGSSEFKELKQNLGYGYEFEKSEILSALSDLHRTIHSLQKTIGSLPAKRKEIEAKRAELAKLSASLPTLPAADQAAQNDLAARIALRKLFEDRVVALKRIQEQIAEAQAKIRAFSASFGKFAKELQAAGVAAGIGPVSLRADFSAAQAAFAERTTALQLQINTLKSGSRSENAALLSTASESWDFDNYDGLLSSIEQRTAQTKAHESLKLKYQQQKLAIAHLQSHIEALAKEIARTESDDIPAHAAARTERFNKYCEYFTVLAAERDALAELYKPLQDSLARGSDTDKRLRFDASFTYDLNGHLQKGLSLLDRTKRGNFRDVDALRAALQRLWDRFSNAGFEPAEMRTALAELWRRFEHLEGETGTTPITIESQLREEYALQDFAGWLLAPSYFGVVSSLKFDDTDLHLLSPGQRGIVLLKLYLGLDTGDKRPLIIDQPEDNLDNLSVYKDLIRLFRERKRHRQIILITHNPNLVVNTDAEQVIVAAYDGKAVPRITYSSGSLENQAEAIPDARVEDLADGIIEKVCHVLEGGPGAFARRFKVYSLSPKIG